ncbi:glycine betaine ABC transporter extracellular binding protein [Planococcus antarcticus DSM 14505]|uniref:Glycine betaine ABC transporter extracellular binding protein n=1 Tax=Planococcus antarcticus DSM 14505 TaxID=1185653 RepID=A0A1C7DJW1_9BACL|nr:glycine betaine ABC transporter substrate-binding protein [Planococcus antarcticus]ANU11879.1 glycine/betaine ABC transporter [Planococcus antarcticus DSM 14505]EIM06988.1 glycine betaine ABC transporter extracellular binding protein [Planococcus antarcticus DSM 14505]
MFNLQWKHLGLLFVLMLVLVVAACGNEEEAETGSAEGSESEDVNYGEEMGYKITGIEPGAGVVAAAEGTIEEYENLEGWEVVTSSSGAMATALGEAIDNEEPIIVTGWSPHWKFQKYDVKYLEDPKGVFGDAETINTMVREGLEEENPEAYKILDQFQWESADIESIMLEISNGTDVEEATTAWVEENSDKVAEWTAGTEKVDGVEIELAYVEWDTEVASTNVVGKVLEDQGFDVTLTPLDNAVMWQAVSEGQADGMVAAWLPGTHATQLETYGDSVVDLGVNLEGAKIGLVVPAYMDIDSIEDLTPTE